MEKFPKSILHPLQETVLNHPFKKIKRVLAFKSLRSRLFLIIIIFLFLPVVILINYNFIYYEKILQQKTSRLVIDNLQKTGRNVENICLDIMKLSSILGTDEIMIDLMKTDNTRVDIKKVDLKNLNDLSGNDLFRMAKIERRINHLKSSIFFNYNVHVIVLGVDGAIYCSVDDVQDEQKFKRAYLNRLKGEDWFKAFIDNHAKAMWKVPDSYRMDNKEFSYISLSRPVKSNFAQENYGMVIVSFSEENFKQVLEEQNIGIVALIDHNKKAIFSTNMSETERQLTNAAMISKIPDDGEGYFFSTIQKNEYLVNYYSLNRFGWTLVSVVPYEEVIQETEKLKKKIFFLNTAIFGTFLLLSMWLIVYATYPLKKLIKNIGNMKIGEHHVNNAHLKGYNDVGELERSFDYMSKRISELVHTVIEEQKAEHELKYEALKAQINSHFLFNTLNTIKWSANICGANNVSEMITSLGMLLEASMNKGEEYISFKQEFELVESYLYIQNVRYNEKFVLRYQVEKEIYDYKILKLILQPIVENAITHGFEDRDSKGCIDIYAYLQENVIKLYISDDGAGMDSDQCEELLYGNCSNDGKRRFSGIGLRNVNERIKHKYGDEYGLKIVSVRYEGTTIEFTLPAIK